MPHVLRSTNKRASSPRIMHYLQTAVTNGSFNILLFYCILYQSSFFDARTNKPLLL